MFVITDCFYRGYGFSCRENRIPAQNRCGNDGIRAFAGGSEFIKNDRMIYSNNERVQPLNNSLKSRYYYEIIEFRYGQPAYHGT